MKMLFLGILLGFGLAALFSSLSSPTVSVVPSYPYSEFVADLDGGKIEEVTLQGPKIFGRFKSKQVFQTLAPHSQVLPALTDRLLTKKVTVTARPIEDDPSVTSVLIAWFPYLINWATFFGGVWLFMTRPILALVRRLDSYIQAQRVPSGEDGARHGGDGG